MLDIPASLQLFNSSHVRERDKGLLRSVMVGGVWNGFLFGRVRHQALPCRFCGAPDGDGHLFWECTCPPLVDIRQNPEFHDLMRMDKEHWPRCLLWHGWLPMLSGVMVFLLGLPVLLIVPVTLLKLRLVVTLLGWLLSGVPLTGMIRLLFLPWSRFTPTFGLMIRSLAFPHLVLVSLLTSLSLFGMLVRGVRLILSALWVMFSPVEVSVLFLGLFNLSKEG